MKTRRVIAAVAGLTTCAITALAIAGDPPADAAADQPEGVEVGVEVGVLTPPEPEVSPAQVAAGKAAFATVFEVLQHPRCMNCHPAGDAPLQTDQSVPHAMNVSRASNEAGLECSACHKEQNSEAVGVPGGPPGAPHWQLPDEEMPLIFQGRTPAQLCAQLKDPAQNGNKTMAQLLHHVGHDPLVLWGWAPGGDRTTPATSHADFVAAFSTWVDSAGACPD